MKLMRWHEMPNFDLYSDQVIAIINQELSFFPLEITNSMINNYVKQKILPLPHKKKYQKDHIGRLLILSLLKTAFSIEEINLYFKEFSKQEDYDHFCQVFEDYWHLITTGHEAKTNTRSDLTGLLVQTIINKQTAIKALRNKEVGQHEK